jgi:hypothetical protein
VEKRQPVPVLVSLPHASADTSNTDSNLKIGVLYGFFPDAAPGVFSLEAFLLSNYPSRAATSRKPHL